eukprot:COSAG06_NODE_32649_length_502_cov_1.851117_2_plen_75_part_01
MTWFGHGDSKKSPRVNRPWTYRGTPSQWSDSSKRSGDFCLRKNTLSTSGELRDVQEDAQLTAEDEVEADKIREIE